MIATFQDTIVDEFRKRTEGLMFLSESDFPIHVYCSQSEEPFLNLIFKISGRSPVEKVEEMPLSFLFKSINTLQEKHNTSSNTSRYNELLKFLTENLNDLRVYKIGELETDVFISGTLIEGTTIILSTKSLESK